MIKTDIILNGRFLELINDVSMPFTYQIADVKDPSKKNTNFSKTITLPGTRVNNEVFGWIWDTNVSINSSGSVNFTPSFNPNKKADVVILYDGAEIFKGFMKLDRIKVLSDYKIEYDVTCFGKLKDLFLEIGEKTLGELDLSKYNHNYTYDILKASWDNYIYKDGQVVPFNKGDGYVYPMVDYAMNNTIDWKTEHFYPCIYYKTVLHEIISQAGFKYDGAIFNDNDFNSLVVNYGNGNLKLSSSQIDNRTFKASNTSDQRFDVSFGKLIDYGSGITNRFNNPQTVLFQNDSTGNNFDGGNNFDTTSSTFTVPYNGLITFETQIDLSITHMPNAATAYIAPAVFLQGWLEIVKNGSQILASLPIYMLEDGYYANNYEPPGQIYLYFSSPITSGTTSLTRTLNLSIQQTFQVGDYVNVFIRRDIGTLTDNSGNILNFYNEDPLSVTSYAKFNLKTGSFFQNSIASVNVAEGDLIDMSNVLPPTIKQKDFLSSFFKLFNIYTETDKDELNYLHFESRPDFYATSGTIRNWDNKLDYSQNYEVIPMGDLDARTYLFKFKDDGDYWNDYYKKKYGETYGQRKFDIDNDWLVNTNLTEVIFSPTPLVERLGDDKIIPRIFQINNNGQAVPKISNLRLWYYGGVKTTANPYNIITSSGTHQLTTYAYAGHLDDVQNPTYDVNYYLPIEVFYTATTYTNNNIFNKYYKQFINEITSKDSKIFKGQFHLNPLDIALLNFRDLYYFHGDYWILNKIYDYNPIEQNKTTTCEFLKLKGGVPFYPTSGTTNGGSGKPLGDDDIFPVGNDSIPYDSNVNSTGVVVTGFGNTVSSTSDSVIVVGDSNTVGSGVSTVSLISSSGTIVYGGVERVTLINTFDKHIDNSYTNKTVINGTVYGQKNIIWSSGTYTFNGTDSGALAVFEIGGNVNVYLPYPSQIKNGYTIEIKNINNGGWKVTLIIQSDSISPTYPAIDSGNPTSFSINPGDHHNFTYYDEFWLIH